MRFLTITFCAVFVLFSLHQAQATIIHVPGDSSTIQGGINGAVDGDTVLVADGTYTGEGNRDIDFLGKAITVRSQSGSPEGCIIDCQSSEADPHRGFIFDSNEGSGSVLCGVTITNGYVVGSGANKLGGGIYCYYSSPTVTNCTFSDNSAWSAGGGLYCHRSACTLTNCIFSNNSTMDYGMGGGMFLNLSTPTLTNCTFFGNSSYGAGGMMCQLSPAFLTNCTFSANSAIQSGAGLACWAASPTLIHCTFSGNVAEFSGGGMFCSHSSPTLVNCTFFGNSGRAGGMECYSYSSATLVNSIIAFSTEGEAIDCYYGSSVTLTCCDIYGNAGGDWVGCIADQYGINGNISCDPMFCYPDTGNYYLADTSCCVGAGCDSLGNPDSTVNIGAFGVGCPLFPPDPFSLLFPPNKAFTPRGVRFDWETPTDPDSFDQVKYDLYVSTSYYFPPAQTTIDSNLTISEHIKRLDYDTYYWKVKAKDNWGLVRWSNQIRYFMVTGMHALPIGDLNGDGCIDIGDVVFSISYLYKSGPPPNPLEAGDCNCDGIVDVGDVIYLINYLFKDGPPPSC